MDQFAVSLLPLGRALCVIVALLAPQLAHADRVGQLIRLLETDDSYKVRLQAAMALGRLKDRRGIPALIQALKDPQHVVRGMSAASIGQIADPRGVPALKLLLRREQHSFVIEQAKKALAGLSQPDSGRFFVQVRKIKNSAGRGGPELATRFQQELTAEFGKAPGVVTRWPSGGMPSATQLKQRKMIGFVIDGAINQLTVSKSGNSLTLSCAVRVSLSTFPGNSMKGFYSGGASMVVSESEFTPRAQAGIWGELLAGAAQGARQQIVGAYLNEGGR
ncbi:MAG: HEAT repeat domain-containing protein [Deltaproteobacteria bacterium]|nr:HEAT repeat domain-containing protein [Deltaproteobacteria bacterium]